VKTKSSVNYGIQARDIHASAIAVGENAHATSTLSTEQTTTLAGLTEAIQRLQLDAARRESLLTNLEHMKNGAALHSKSTFEKIVSTLKEVGHVAELVAPLKAVAAAFGLAVTL